MKNVNNNGNKNNRNKNNKNNISHNKKKKNKINLFNVFTKNKTFTIVGSIFGVIAIFTIANIFMNRSNDNYSSTEYSKNFSSVLVNFNSKIDSGKKDQNGNTIYEIKKVPYDFMFNNDNYIAEDNNVLRKVIYAYSIKNVNNDGGNDNIENDKNSVYDITKELNIYRTFEFEKKDNNNSNDINNNNNNKDNDNIKMKFTIDLANKNYVKESIQQIISERNNTCKIFVKKENKSTEKKSFNSHILNIQPNYQNVNGILLDINNYNYICDYKEIPGLENRNMELYYLQYINSDYIKDNIISVKIDNDIYLNIQYDGGNNNITLNEFKDILNNINLQKHEEEKEKDNKNRENNNINNINNNTNSSNESSSIIESVEETVSTDLLENKNESESESENFQIDDDGFRIN